MTESKPRRGRRTLFDRWARNYDRSALQARLFRVVHEEVLQALDSAGTPHDVLDVGCGTGHLLELATERWNARATGIDLSGPMIAEACRKYGGDGRFTFERGDASELPLAADAFDAVFSTMSFHHWGDQAAGVREAARVLRPGGHFVLADAYVPGVLRPLAGWIDHAKFLGPQAIAELLEQGGFTVALRRRFRNPRFQMFVAQKNR